MITPTTTVYYNISAPTTPSGSISGSFSVVYDNINPSNSPTLNSVNITTPIENYIDASGYNPMYILAPGSYQLQLNGSGGQTVINYLDSDFYDSSAIVDSGTGSFAMMSSYTYSSGGTMDGSLIDPACFTRNTLISTPTGSTPVQDLAIGDLILNHQGQAVPVKWIGTQRVHPAFGKDNLPVCIRAGALGSGLPLRDLFVSPCHAMYLADGVLVQAKALINGITINQVQTWKGDVEYFHIETEHHEIILAEGAPTETFVDNISRECFNNYSEYHDLYPDAHEMVELDIPRISHQRQLPNAIKNKLEVVASSLLGNEAVVKAA
jgi:Hint domain